MFSRGHCTTDDQLKRLQTALTGQGRVQFVAKEALPLLSSLIELPASFRHNPVPQPEETTHTFNTHKSIAQSLRQYNQIQPHCYFYYARGQIISVSSPCMCFFTYCTYCIYKLNEECRVYLSPILIASSGEQEIVSGQLGDLCCLLSRNQPESTSPRT